MVGIPFYSHGPGRLKEAFLLHYHGPGRLKEAFLLLLSWSWEAIPGYATPVTHPEVYPGGICTSITPEVYPGGICTSLLTLRYTRVYVRLLTLRYTRVCIGLPALRYTRVCISVILSNPEVYPGVYMPFSLTLRYTRVCNTVLPSRNSFRAGIPVLTKAVKDTRLANDYWTSG